MSVMRDVLQACCLAGLMAAAPALAQDNAPALPAAPAQMKSPRLSSAAVDWDAVRAALGGLEPLKAPSGASAAEVLAQLNAATAKVFANIAASPVPVLLPFDTQAYLRDAGQGAARETGKYLSGFDPAMLFFPGPSGYDAVVLLRPGATPNLKLTYARPVHVQISGSALIYDLDGSAAPGAASVPQFDADFPGIRRVLMESHVRYTFVRYGVPYFVTIECFDGAGSARRLSCREADKVAERFLKGLNVVGGTPHAKELGRAPQAIAQPDKISPDFTYFAPGDILPGTGTRGRGGRADFTVYAGIRFPMAQAPAYANSQSFMNWGNCDLTGRVRLGGRGSEAYRCRVNDRPLVSNESKNYAYPWRDNFCEHREYYVGQCPAGLGHQGQDIRPGKCLEPVEDAGRCAPYQQDVVAVSDGVIMRSPGDHALYLVIDKPGVHIRFRYLHMNPHMLDAAGMVSGRHVVEGEVLGAVGNYGREAGGTSYHLHFDAQVPTRDGWVFVNPYMTLVASYERLIGARGRVVDDAMFAPPALPAMAADGSQAPDGAVVAEAKIESAPKADAHEHKAAAEHCTTSMHRGHRRHICRDESAEERPHRSPAHVVRTGDRRGGAKAE